MFKNCVLCCPSIGARFSPSNLETEGVAAGNGDINGLDLADGNCIDELRVGDCPLLEALVELLFNRGNKADHSVDLCVALLEDCGDLGHGGKGGLAVEAVADLVLGVGLRSHVQDAGGEEGGLGNGHAASEQALADDLNAHLFVSGLDVVVVVTDVGKLVEEGLLGELDLVEPHTGVVKIVSDGLGSHVINPDSLAEVPVVVAKAHMEGVRAVRLRREVG